MNKTKRGAVTIFIIIGILILVTVAIFIFFMQGRSKNEITTQTDINAVKMSLTKYTDKCVFDTGLLGLRLLGARGGYLSRPKYIYELSSHNTSYLFYKGENLLPTITEMENDISQFVNAYLPVCMNYSEYDGYEIVAHEPNTETIISSGKVAFNVDWNIQIASGDMEGYISEFNAVVPLDLHKFHNTSAEIVKRTEMNPNFIDQIHLLEQNMNITYTIDYETVVYSIQDVQMNKDEFDYMYVFAVNINENE